MDVCLKNLEARLAAIEKDLGNNEGDERLIDELVMLDTAAKELAASRDRVKMVFKRVDEVQEYITPGFTEEQSMDIDAQREYALMMEKNIQDTVRSLSRVQELSRVLNSDNIRKLQGTGASKMQDMQLKQLSQLKLVDDVSLEISDLVETYNNLVTEISKYILQISDIVNNLEIDASKEVD